jgi:hypothetical protein
MDERDLGDTTQLRIGGHVPRIQQPFWDVAPISILQAPMAKLSRKGIVVWRQSQSPQLHFKRGRGPERMKWVAPVWITSAIHRVF